MLAELRAENNPFGSFKVEKQMACNDDRVDFAKSPFEVFLEKVKHSFHHICDHVEAFRMQTLRPVKRLKEISYKFPNLWQFD